MRQKLFITSDWHLGHANAIIYDERPFETTEEMERVLIKRFNATVPPDGITYFVGDMGRINHMKKVIDQLNGRKILILGNHDRKMNRMYHQGFDHVMYGVQLVIAHQIVTISHCPLTGVFREDTTLMRGHVAGQCWHREEVNRKFSFPDDGQFHLHGHVHFRPGKGELKSGRQWDIGVPGNGYAPVSFSRIESWIVKRLEEETRDDI